ncbi:hypothetical protein [Paenibacillus donghaensis]|uniref:Uncharacterized protein n=1 Tax=Paenibacillus donghaensis TaxID=414771 RepID=A0A2Z2KRJ3_9BACL|nr:hypothetical protein [Paenibacillus donghaensis]ASA21608.1 hypothetical protein B9T62_13010 [Paenibacillus donghaensis]
MSHNADEREKLLFQVAHASFPSYQESNISTIINNIEFQGSLPHSDCFEVTLNNELLSIPYRIYFKEPTTKQMSQLSSEQVVILNCLFTRHHNGYIRERNLKEIILVDKPTVIPFVIQLAGEYVYEIVEIIYEHLNYLNIDNYLNFITANPAYYQKTKARMISYWNCNHRNQHKNLSNYKGLQIFKYFEKNLR